MNTTIAYQPNNRAFLFKSDILTELKLVEDRVSFWRVDWLTGIQEHYRAKDLVAKWIIKLK